MSVSPISLMPTTLFYAILKLAKHLIHLWLCRFGFFLTINLDFFVEDEAKLPFVTTQTSNLYGMVSQYNKDLFDLLNKHASIKTKTIVPLHLGWQKNWRLSKRCTAKGESSSLQYSTISTITFTDSIQLHYGKQKRPIFDAKLLNVFRILKLSSV